MIWVWLSGERHVQFEAKMGLLQTKMTVTVDGLPIDAKPKLRFGGRSYHFELDGQSALLKAKTNLVIPEATLTIGGIELVAAEIPDKLPLWVWIFFIANVALPVIAAGGAIPAALGVAGAFGCIAAARGEDSVAKRIWACAAITSTVWALFYLVVRYINS